MTERVDGFNSRDPGMESSRAAEDAFISAPQPSLAIRAILDGIQELFVTCGAPTQNSPLAFSSLVAEANDIMLPTKFQDDAFLENRVREIATRLEIRATIKLRLILAEHIKNACQATMIHY